MELVSVDGSFAVAMVPDRGPTPDPRFWRLTVRFDGTWFGEDGPNLIWADLAGLAALWTATEPALDPDAAPPEQILATILGDDRLHDATLPNLGESFDRRGPIRRYRWKDEVVWLHRVSPDGSALDHVRLARVPVDAYLDVVRRATDHHRTPEA